MIQGIALNTGVLPFSKGRTLHEAPRIANYDEATSNEALQDNVDALDETRDIELARSTQYQHNFQNYHSHRVRPCSFMVGDLVL
jgi:hypothetical protein